jgi:hypothetical protein
VLKREEREIAKVSARVKVRVMVKVMLRVRFRVRKNEYPSPSSGIDSSVEDRGKRDSKG